MRRCCWSGGVARSGFRLSPGERERISRAVGQGVGSGDRERGAISVAVGLLPKDRGWGWPGARSAVRAECRAARRARRPKATKLFALSAVGRGGGGGGEVVIRRGRSRPDWRGDHPDDLEMRISPETIYLSLYVQSRGELRRRLSANLRSGRTKRRAVGRIPASWADRGDDPDLAASRVSRGPRGAGPWESNVVVGHELSLGGRDAGGAPDPVREMLAWLGNDHSTLTVIETLENERDPASARRTWCAR